MDEAKTLATKDLKCMEALTAAGTFPMDAMTQLTPVQFLISPGLWIGLGITAEFLAAAVRLRHSRGPV